MYTSVSGVCPLPFVHFKNCEEFGTGWSVIYAGCQMGSVARDMHNFAAQPQNYIYKLAYCSVTLIFRTFIWTSFCVTFHIQGGDIICLFLIYIAVINFSLTPCTLLLHWNWPIYPHKYSFTILASHMLKKSIKLLLVRICFVVDFNYFNYGQSQSVGTRRLCSKICFSATTTLLSL